jgi:hypothetical protein
MIDLEMNEDLGHQLNVDYESSEAAPETDTPTLTVDAQGRTHGPDGKFVSNSEDSQETEETEEAETADEPAAEQQAADEQNAPQDETPEGEEADASEEYLEVDPDHPFFAKYGGDPDKAFAALEEAQRHVGRVGNEVGDLRKENEQLQQLLAQMQALETRLTPYQNDPEDNPQGLIQEVLQRAGDTGHFDEATYNRALALWAEEEPFAAARLDAQVAMAKAMAAQTPEPAQAEPEAPDALAAEVEAFKERNPDFQTLIPEINKIAEERPLLRQALESGTAQSRAMALQDLYDLAKSRSNVTATSEATRKVILRAAQEADKAKSDAAVVGASRSSGATPPAPSGNKLLEQTLRELHGLDDFVIE